MDSLSQPRPDPREADASRQTAPTATTTLTRMTARSVSASLRRERRRHRARREAYAERSPALDNVIVGERKLIRRENHARSSPLLELYAPLRQAGHLDGLDDRTRIRVEQRIVADGIGLMSWIHESIVKVPGARHITRIGRRKAPGLRGSRA